MPTKQNDLTTREMVLVLRNLDAHLPISDEYEQKQPQKSRKWWSSQLEHMVSWFSAQTSPEASAMGPDLRIGFRGAKKSPNLNDLF